MWQHVKLSERIRPRDTLACCWDVKQPTNQQTVLTKKIHLSCLPSFKSFGLPGSVSRLPSFKSFGLPGSVRCLPSFKSFGLPGSVRCLPSFKSFGLPGSVSRLPSFKSFGLPGSFSCLVYTNRFYGPVNQLELQ